MNSSSSAKISLATATIVGMNAMIGAGIFAVPSTIATYVGPAGILGYVLVVGAVWCIALSLARLATLFPEPGAFYIYTRYWAGHTGGMIACSMYFVGLLIAMGLLSKMAGLYLYELFPEGAVYAPSAFVLGLITLIGFVALNMFGVTLSSLGQQILIVCTVCPLVITTLMCLSKAKLSYLIPFAPYGVTNVIKATRVIIFGFFGFECAASLFSLVENPERNVPRALTYSIGLVGILYILFISSIILSTPAHYFTSSLLLPAILRITFPGSSWIIAVIHIATLSAILGTIHSMIWSSSNLLLELLQKSKNSYLQQALVRNTITHRSAVLFVGSVILLSYVTIQQPTLFFCLTAAFVITAYMMSMVSLLYIKKEWELGNNRITLCGLLCALVIFYFALEGIVTEALHIVGH